MTVSPLAGARAIALRSLLANVEPLRGGSVLTAGRKQFRSIWTRDFCFAAGGLMAAGRADVVRDTVRTILSFQRGDGLLPRLLDSASWAARVVFGALGHEAPLRDDLRPNYIGEHLALAIDGNALIVWTAARYVAASGDDAFARETFPALEKAARFYDSRLEGGLLVQPPFSDWQDSVSARRGRVFMTNLLYWRALLSLAELAPRAGSGAASAWRERAESLRATMDAFYWDENGGFYRNLETGGPLSTDGCLFAVLWDFGGPERSRRILNAMEAAGSWTPWGPHCAVPDYSFRARGWITRFAGIPDYHDRMLWLWQNGLAIRALRSAGEGARALDLALSTAKLVERDGACCEVYEPEDGRPVRRRFYRSESPFSWSSGMLLEGFDEILGAGSTT